MREYVVTTVVNLTPALVAFYGLRLLDVTQYLALVGAIVTAVVQGLITMVRKRKFEPMNGLVIVAAAVSLVVAFSTKNPRVVQLTELIPATLTVWACLISGVLRRPISKQFTGVIVPGLADRALPGRGWSDQDIKDWHSLHSRLCISLGGLCSLFPALAAYMVFTLPVDVSQFLLAVVGSGLLIVSVAAAIAFLRRFVRGHDRPAGVHPDHVAVTDSPIHSQ